MAYSNFAPLAVSAQEIERTSPMKLNFAIVFLAGYYVCAEAAVIHVAQDGMGDFTTIQSAVNAAADGDTVVIQPNLVPYSENVNIQTRIALLGRGYACSGESRPQINGQVNFQGNSSGSVISGLAINSRVEIFVPQVTIHRCYIDGDVPVVTRANASSLITECHLHGGRTVYTQGNAVVSVQNSVLTGNYIARCESPSPPPTILIRNCSIYGVVPEFDGTANWTIDHCIFGNIQGSGFGALSGTWQTGYNAYPANMANFPSSPATDTLIADNPWVAPGYSPCNSDWHLLPESGLIDRGDPNFAPDRDGSRRDLGVYGGSTPYVPDMTPAFPFVTSFSVPIAVPQNGVLEIRSTGRVGQGN